MNEKSKKILGWCIEIIGVIGVVILIANFLYPSMLKMENLEQTYKEKKESCEFLKTVAKDSIEEGKNINKKNISDNIEYEIKEEEDKIVFSYNIIDEESDDVEYYAKITLNKDYKIIEEDYEPELVSYEKYMHDNESVLKFFSYLVSFLIIIAIYLIGMLISLMLGLTEV